jgi:hypothetical protein
MVIEPPETPETRPVDDPIAPIVGLLLVHLPPDVALNKVTVCPTQTLVDPVIGENGCTVIVVVETHAPVPMA